MTPRRPSTSTAEPRTISIDGGRGSSEVIGFALVFAVVFAGVGVVYGAGFDTLSEVRDREEAASAERAFLALAGAVDDVQRQDVGRSGVLSLGTGRLQVHAGPTVAVHANGTTRTVETGAVSYRTAGTRVTHEGGAVFRADGDDGALLREPAMACRPGSDVAIISVVTLQSEGTGIDADGPVEVVLRPTATEVWRAERATVTVSPSAHGDAWGRYLERSGWNDTGESTYGCDAERTFVRRTAVRLRFVS